MTKRLHFKPKFVPEGETAESQFRWSRRDAVIKSSDGTTVFRQTNVEAPEAWSLVAIEIAASKYFRKLNGKQESSVRQLVRRVVDSILASAKKQKIFASKKDYDCFREDLTYILLSQRAFFNSPVWFNCGVHKNPQVSACFIQSINDDIEGIFELLKNEAKIFKFGSGSGTNFSKLRSKYEELQAGGKSSGMMAFLEVFDRGAASIKSGGTTRRAAKMVCVDVDHPEILEFIDWKAHEEKKAKALIREGYSSEFEGEAYRSVSGQNSNNSVRVTNQFMKAVQEEKLFPLKYRTNKRVFKKLPAKEVWNSLTQAAWECGDPGVQFVDAINSWHTCPQGGSINASNPCSEYMFLDNSACNLASLNLLKFLEEDGRFDWNSYGHTVRTVFLAQEILVEMAGYPTEEIKKNSLDYRPIGLGFCGLGAFLMRKGIPYDSDEGRFWASGLSSLLLAESITTSAELAKILRPFSGFRKNQEAMKKVMVRHQRANNILGSPDAKVALGQNFLDEIHMSWQRALELGKKYGYRNAQFTVMAPTGTIGLVMDAETTGIEPEYSLVKTKSLAGAGEIKTVSSSVAEALRILGYSKNDISKILEYLDQTGSLVKCAIVKKEHLPIFACAHVATSGAGGFAGKLDHEAGTLSWQAHLKMMAAVQPFLSGAISKTVNLPHFVSADVISEVYFEAWRLGLKSISIYRDGCKGSQPLISGLGMSCPECGSPARLVGGCYQCINCGYTTGCVS